MKLKSHKWFKWPFEFSMQLRKHDCSNESIRFWMISFSREFIYIYRIEIRSGNFNANQDLRLWKWNHLCLFLFLSLCVPLFHSLSFCLSWSYESSDKTVPRSVLNSNLLDWIYRCSLLNLSFNVFFSYICLVCPWDSFRSIWSPNGKSSQKININATNDTWINEKDYFFFIVLRCVVRLLLGTDYVQIGLCAD